MEIPPHGRPQHHGNLARGRRDRFEVTRGRVDYIRNVERIAVQGGDGEAGSVIAIINALSVRAWGRFDSIFELFSVYDNRPARWKGGVLLDVEVGGFECYPTKDWRDSEGEAIGQVAGGVSHGEVIQREREKA